MILTNMLKNLRIELQDSIQSGVTPNYTNDELVRAIEKSVSLMSRIIPDRKIKETTIVREIIGETVSVSAAGIGLLAYRPVKKDSIVVTGKTLDTDYRVDYLIGKITQIGSGLPADDYTVSYELDSGMLDLSDLLSDYIKIERVEYPVGQTPPTLLTFDTYGDIMVFRGNVTLTENEHLRIIYLDDWEAPTQTLEGTYPEHLNDAIIIGSVGQSLIYKAERYTQSSVDVIDDIIDRLAELDDLWPSIGSLTPPDPPELGELTPPDGYTISKPTSPTLPELPTAPTPPTLDFTEVETALDGVANEITAAKAKLSSGENYINAATRGESVAYNYGQYGSTVMAAAGHKVNEGVARLRQVEETLSKYSAEVTSYGSDVNAYANQVSGMIGKYREEINAESLGVSNAASEAQVFTAKVRAQEAQVNVYQAEVAGFQAEIANIQNLVNIYSAKAQAIINRAAQESAQVQNYLDAAGRFLASGQAKINEMLVMVGAKPEFQVQKGSSEQRS